VPTDAAVAARAARAAAEVLLRVRAGGLSGRPLGDAGDAAAQEAIVAVLTADRPGDLVFSEEAVDDPRRPTADRVWIVDPLDGTREYGEAGRHDWAVHVALWADGDLSSAAVALPALDEVLVTEPAPAVPPSAPGRPRIAVSRSRPPAEADVVAAARDAERVPLVSAGYKTGAVARAAGLTACRLDGSPLVYNDPDPWLPDLVVCRPELAAPILAAVRSGR
jgi:3'(2'), 5'-bisphosphate nucleotidase